VVGPFTIQIVPIKAIAMGRRPIDTINDYLKSRDQQAESKESEPIAINEVVRDDA
jgi:hypothetical protein